MTWPTRLAVCGALCVAGLVGWASGTVVQEAVGRLWANRSVEDAVVSTETRVDASPARDGGFSRNSPETVVAAASPLPDIVPDIAEEDADAPPTETEPTVSELEPSAEPPQDAPTAGTFGTTIQVGVFRESSNAERLGEDLRAKYDQVHVSRLPTDLYIVMMGPFQEKPTADRIAQEIQREMGLSPLVLRTRL
ncbi:MAG: SPOR domain-containing protein [Gemmatimonadales bacterium]